MYTWTNTIACNKYLKKIMQKSTYIEWVLKEKEERTRARYILHMECIYICIYLYFCIDMYIVYSIYVWELSLPIQVGIFSTLSFQCPPWQSRVLVGCLVSGKTLPWLHWKVLDITVSFVMILPLGVGTSGQPTATWENEWKKKIYKMNFY